MDLREERNTTYGSGNITYYLNQTITQAPYKEFSSVISAAAEQVVTLAVAKETTSVIAEFETAAGSPGTTQIVGGLWSLYLHFNAGAAGQNWIIRPAIFKRNSGGTETLVFTPDPVIVNNMNTTTEMYLSDGVFPNTTLLTTDRLVVRISVQNMGTVSQTISFRTEGSQHYSVVSTTLNPTAAAAGLTGFGTTNTLSKFTGTGSIGNSLIYDDGTSTGIGTTSADSRLYVLAAAAQKYAIQAQSIKLSGYAGYFHGHNGAYFEGGGNGAGSSTIGYGVYAIAYDSITNIAVSGVADNNADYTATTNIGANFVANNATNNYSIQLQDGTEGVGKVLTSMTADGKARWATPASGGLTYFTEAQNSATPNATVKVDSLTALSSTTNADISIVPKGTGAFILAVPDNLVAGGNKRGTYAIDLQTSRSSAAQVASGSGSILIGGYNNTASGTGVSVIGGYGSTNSGSYGITAGAELNNSGAYGACLFGWASSTSGNSSFVSGYGNSNSANYNGTIGSSNVSGSNYGFTAGISNTNTSPTSLVFGASNSCLTGGNNIVLGAGGTTMSGNYGRFVFAARNTVVGDAQNTRMILSRRTTDATLTSLTVDGAAPYFGVTEFKFQDNTCVRFKGTIVGKKTATTNVGVWDIDGVVTRVNSVATTTIVVSNINVVTNASTWGTPTLTINGSYGNLSVNVIGLAATNIQWVSHIEFTEVVY